MVTFTKAEQDKIVTLKFEGKTLQEIALILHRRYNDVLIEARRLFYQHQPPPNLFRYVKDTMSHADYKRIRGKVRSNWLWQVTFTGVWGTVSRPHRFVKTSASSKASRTLDYGAHTIIARENSKDIAMGKLASSDIYLAKLISIDVNRIRGIKR